MPGVYVIVLIVFVLCVGLCLQWFVLYVKRLVAYLQIIRVNDDRYKLAAFRTFHLYLRSCFAFE